MIPLIPWYITLIVLAINLTIAVTVWRLVSNAAGRSGLPPTTRRAVRAGSALFLGAWLGAALLAAPAPASLAARDEFYITPLIPLFAALGLTIVSLALWRSAALRSVVADPRPDLRGAGVGPAARARPRGVVAEGSAGLGARVGAAGVTYDGGARTGASTRESTAQQAAEGAEPRERPAPRVSRSAPRSSRTRDGDSSHRTDGARGEHRARIRALSVATYRR